MREPGFYVVLSRAHAEEILPALHALVLERIDRLSADFGALLLEVDAGGVGNVRVLNNGIELVSRLT